MTQVTTASLCITMAASTVVFVYLFTAVLATDHLNSLLFNGNYEFIDLTHPFDNDTIYWPGVQNFIFTKQIENQDINKWYASKEFKAGEHGGTHIDAPYHTYRYGKYVGDIPLEKLIVPLVIVDISSKVNGNPNFILYKHDLDYMLYTNMQQPCLIIFKFGWSQYFNNRTKYLGIQELTNKLSFPGLSVEVTEWITSYKNIVGIGVDVASIDPGSIEDLSAHKVASAAGLYNLENVNLNVNIPNIGCVALVMPMKIATGTGAPLRLTAICPKQAPTSFN